MTTALPAPSADIHNIARTAVLQLVSNIAAATNTPVDSTYCTIIADRMTAELGARGCLLFALRNDAMREILGNITRELDSKMQWRVVRELEAMDKTRAGHHPDLASMAAAALELHKTRSPFGKPVRWSRPAEMLRQFQDTADAVGPVTVLLLNGSLCTSYWLRRRLHRDPRQGPARHCEWIHLQRDEYWLHGKLHRDPRQGPAVRQRDHGTGFLLEIYYWRGKRHRDSRLGPAWRCVKNGAEYRELRRDGGLHHEPAEGPALAGLTLDDGSLLRGVEDGSQIAGEEYYAEGQLHRPAREGPAVIYTDHTGRRVLEAYYEHGVLHRDPGDGPAWRALDGDIERLKYRLRGKLHRDESEGPALVERNNATGTVLTEQYCHMGKLHRRQGPAIITRHPQTGQLEIEAYYRHGQPHRDDGPAHVSYYQNGALDVRSWFRHGKLHRDPAQGAAVTVWNEDGRLNFREFWLAGERIARNCASAPTVTSGGRA